MSQLVLLGAQSGGLEKILSRMNTMLVKEFDPAPLRIPSSRATVQRISAIKIESKKIIDRSDWIAFGELSLPA